MIRCIAIDDEPLALRQVERYIDRMPDVTLVGTFYSPLQAKSLIESETSADKVDVIYLLKPLSFEQMAEAFERVKRRMSADMTSVQEKAFIFVKSSRSVRRLAIGDILYIKGLGEYVQIYIKGESSPIVTFDSIKRLEKELVPHDFMRVHKSYLVNLNAIDATNRSSVEISGALIPIGEKYRDDFTRIWYPSRWQK